MIRKTLITLLLIATQFPSLACSCENYEPVFCRIVHDQLNIVKVVVTDSTTDHILKVNLLENIHGDILEDSLLILGQDGLNCGESLNPYKANDTLILAVSNVVDSGISYWYLEGACGLHSLRYENGIVIGQITDSLTTQPIAGFKADLFSCLEMKAPVEAAGFDLQVSIFPNPVKDIFHITTDQNFIIGYGIYNLGGQQVTNETLDIYKNTVEVELKDFENGIYYIQIITSKGTITRRLLKI